MSYVRSRALPPGLIENVAPFLETKSKIDDLNTKTVYSDLNELASYFTNNQGPVINVTKSSKDKNQIEDYFFVEFLNKKIFAIQMVSEDLADKLFALIVDYFIRFSYFNYLEYSDFSNEAKYIERMVEEEANTGNLIPRTAPEKWPGKHHTDEEIPDFVKRVWGDYFSYGLRLYHFKSRDEKLWFAISNYRRSNQWPDDLAFLSQRDVLKKNIRKFSENATQLEPHEIIAVMRKIQRDSAKKNENSRMRANDLKKNPHRPRNSYNKGKNRGNDAKI